MSKLEKKLPGMYREMHEKKAFKGDSWTKIAGLFSDFVYDKILAAADRPLCVLDYGCGPAGGLALYGPWQPLPPKFDRTAIAYDPYVEAYQEEPWEKPFNVFFSCDVFEHLPLATLHRLLGRLRDRKDLLVVYLSITTRPANKTLPNGLNAHLIVQPPDWWHGMLVGGLGDGYSLETATADIVDGECTFGFRRLSS